MVTVNVLFCSFFIELQFTGNQKLDSIRHRNDMKNSIRALDRFYGHRSKS